MRFARTLGLLAVVLALQVGTAKAQVRDCMAADYLAAFPDAPTAEGLTCVELFRFEVATPAGPRVIRGIADAAADWAAPPAMVAEVERGARLAGAGLAGLGRYEIDNVTLLLLDDIAPFEEVTPDPLTGQVLGVTLADPALSGSLPPECLITIYALAAGATDGSMATTVAHEIFHCVQGATYAGGKYDTYGAGGTWWIEGAAEAFAAAAVPDNPAFTDRSAAFDAGVAGRVALHDMEHEAAHFFYWLMQTRGGLAALMPFQDEMADTGGAAAQQAAMRAAMSPEEWATFAQAYADGTIHHPRGGTLASEPPEGTVLMIADSGRHSLPLAPFTLTLGRAGYACGVWGNRVRPGVPGLTWKADGSDGPWGALPDTLDSREGGDADWRLVALPVDDSLTEADLQVERRQSCTPCQGTDAIDACLIGTWAMTGGGAAEWMRAQGFPATVATSGTEAIRFAADGGFATAAFDVSADAAANGVTFEGDGTVLAGQGAWSVAAGTLNICAETGGMGGSMTVATGDGSATGSVGAPGGGSMTMRYSCAGGNLTTTLEIPGLPDMVTSYSKIAE